MASNRNPKKYFVVTNDEYELILAMGTLREIQESSKFTIAQMRTALHNKRTVLGYKQEYKFIEDKGDTNGE